MLAQRRGALLSALAAVPGLAQEESTQQQVAMCLAAMPDPQEARQLLIEVTSLQDDPSAPVQALLKNTHPLWRVQAVSLVCEQGQWLYRYDNGQGTRGAPVEVRGGDVFHPSYEAPDASAAAEQAGLYTHWRAVGVVMLDAGDDPARLIN
jgi:hypothetical protein